MSLEKCLSCDLNFLTEAEPYTVFPHNSGYHLFCFDCSSQLGYARMFKTIKEKILDKEVLLGEDTKKAGVL